MGSRCRETTTTRTREKREERRGKREERREKRDERIEKREEGGRQQWDERRGGRDVEERFRALRGKREEG